MLIEPPLATRVDGDLRVLATVFGGIASKAESENGGQQKCEVNSVQLREGRKAGGLQDTVEGDTTTIATIVTAIIAPSGPSFQRETVWVRKGIH